MSNGNSTHSEWTVGFSKKADKQKSKLPPHIDDILAALVTDIKLKGPALLNTRWKHYGKLENKKGEYHHCHLHDGRPTYVVAP